MKKIRHRQKYLAVSGIVIRQYQVNPAGTAPSISINLHAVSTALGVRSFETLCDAWSNMAHTTIVTVEEAKIPNPCIENTAAMNAPRVLLLANSDMIVADKG